MDVERYKRIFKEKDIGISSHALTIHWT